MCSCKRAWLYRIACCRVYKCTVRQCPRPCSYPLQQGPADIKQRAWQVGSGWQRYGGVIPHETGLRRQGSPGLGYPNTAQLPYVRPQHGRCLSWCAWQGFTKAPSVLSI